MTAIRFFAASWVLLYHFRLYAPDSGLKPMVALFSGFLGVDFFFVLSGFVLAHVYVAQVASGSFDYWDFIGKRLARLYPMHLLIFFLVLGYVSQRLGWEYMDWDPAVWLRFGGDTAARGIFAHLTLIQAWGATKGLMFNLPSWSISAEWFAYLLFPVLATLILSGRGRPGLTVLAATAVLLVMTLGAKLAGLAPLAAMTSSIGALRILPEFLLGVALYQHATAHALGKGASIGGLVVSLGAVIGGIAIDYSYAPVVLGLAGIVYFAAQLERVTGFPDKGLGGALILLGEISYSIYMVHFAIGVVVLDHFWLWERPRTIHGGLAMLALGLALTTLVSWVTYNLVEIPARRLAMAGVRRVRRPLGE